MADRLYLSCTLRGFTGANMLRHYEKLLKAFPYSRLATVGGTLRLHAVSDSEPVLYESTFDPPPDPDEILTQARQFMTADCAVEFETFWDLWQYDSDWKLMPSRVMLGCYGLQYEGSDGDNLRIEFGLDELFLPQKTLPNHLFMAQSNIRSLLQLVGELDRVLTLESRRLWSESGENFAEQVQAALEDRPEPDDEPLGPRLLQ